MIREQIKRNEEYLDDNQEPNNIKELEKMKYIQEFSPSIIEKLADRVTGARAQGLRELQKYINNYYKDNTNEVIKLALMISKADEHHIWRSWFAAKARAKFYADKNTIVSKLDVEEADNRVIRNFATMYNLHRSKNRNHRDFSAFGRMVDEAAQAHEEKRKLKLIK